MSGSQYYERMMDEYRKLIADLKAEREVKRLQAENEKLRKELAVNEPLFEKPNATNDGLISENAKLRELLLDVWESACRFDSFWDYVHDDGEVYNLDELPHYLERMRDLGIEVE